MKVRQAIDLAAHVAARSSILPILQHLRIAGGHITACDLEQQIEIPVDLPDHAEDFCVHGARLARILKSLPEDAEIEFVAQPGQLTLTAGATRFELNTLAAADFPRLDVPLEDAASVRILAEPLVKALKFCRAAMGVDDVRQYLNGLHLAFAPARIEFTATDGVRMHRTAIEAYGGEKLRAHEAIIPRAFVDRLIETAAEHEDVEFTLHPQLLLMHLGDELLSTKLIDGEFPSVDRVIPARRHATGAIARAAFSEALKRVTRVFASDKVATVSLDIRPEYIDLEARTGDGERGCEHFAWSATNKKFKHLRIGFQAVYLTDALDAFSGDEVFLQLPETEEGSLYITDAAEGKRQAVVMPRRL